MKIKNIYEYKITSTFDDEPKFELKLFEIEVGGKRRSYGEPWYCGTDAKDKLICEVESLDSNKVIGDGVMYFSKIQDDESEIIKKILNVVENRLKNQMELAKKMEIHSRKKIEYIKSSVSFERKFTEIEGLQFGVTGPAKTLGVLNNYALLSKEDGKSKAGDSNEK
jgi:hypothetical protein